MEFSDIRTEDSCATAARVMAVQSREEWAARALAGTGAGIVATVLCSPLDVAKTRVQVQSAAGGQYSNLGVWSALAKIRREEGLIGWYHGFVPAIASVTVFWTCYFPCYEFAKQKFAALLDRSDSAPVVHVTAAASAGLFTDVVTNPLWVVRTRLATQALRPQTASAEGAVPPVHYRSMRHCFQTIFREEVQRICWQRRVGTSSCPCLLPLFHSPAPSPADPLPRAPPCPPPSSSSLVA